MQDETISNPNVADIVAHYRAVVGREMGEKKPLSQRSFARHLSRVIAPHDAVSCAAVSNWEHDTVPPYWFLVGLYQNFPGWPRQFAFDCLRRVWPELWGDGPALGIAKADFAAAGFDSRALISVDNFGQVTERI